jgi:hypothetical protein
VWHIYPRFYFYGFLLLFFKRSIINGGRCAGNKMACLPIQVRCCPANMSVFFPISAISALTGIYLGSIILISCCKKNTRLIFRGASPRDSTAAINFAARNLWPL